MYVVDVNPISKGVFVDELSYFSPTPVVPGSILSVPIRSKDKPALVIRCEPVKNRKGDLRSRSHQLKKINPKKSTQLLLPQFIAATKDIARYFITTPGATILALTPSAVLLDDTPDADPSKEQSMIDSTTSDQEILSEPHVIQASDDDRIGIYRSAIRSTFAQRKSVFVCAPSIQHIEHIQTELSRGIEQRTIVLNTNLTPKKIRTLWKQATTEDHPVLIIATGSFLGLPRTDYGLIIVDSENSRSYQTPFRPHLDIRHCAETIAHHYDTELLLGDMLLRMETHARLKDGTVSEYAPLKFRMLSTAETTLIDMRKEDAPKKKPSFSIFSNKLKNILTDAQEANDTTILIASRIGKNPVTICSDCQEVVYCHNCDHPVALHEVKGVPTFICHSCGSRRSTEERCTNCNSWRLTPLGIGTQLVEEALAKQFSKSQILRFDSTTVRTTAQGTKLAQKFYATPGGILVGTEMVIPYLNEPIGNISIITMDSLFSLPDFRIRERIFTTLMRLKEKATKTFSVQTRMKKTDVFDLLMKSNASEFVRNELAERKEFAYPPYTTFIKITSEGGKSVVLERMRELTDILEDRYDIHTFPAFIPTVKNKYRMHAVLRIKPDMWIDDALYETLKDLPPHFIIHVDPENLL